MLEALVHFLLVDCVLRFVTKTRHFGTAWPASKRISFLAVQAVVSDHWRGSWRTRWWWPNGTATRFTSAPPAPLPDSSKASPPASGKGDYILNTPTCCLGKHPRSRCATPSA